MKRLAAIGVLLIAFTLPAKATEWLICSDGGKASIRVLLGQMNVTDAAVDAIVAQLRLFKATEGDDYVSGGTLRVAGEGAWPVTCSGP